jgi:drug/metabolite transporter (DMT)-like permease
MKNVVVATAAWIASMPFTRELTTPWLFVPINILFACAVGTACAFAWAKEPIVPRVKMWKMMVACFFMGAAFTACCSWIVSHVWEDMKITEGAQAGMGAVVSYITKSFLPWVRDFVAEGKWTDYIPWKRKE